MFHLYRYFHINGVVTEIKRCNHVFIYELRFNTKLIQQLHIKNIQKVISLNDCVESYKTKQNCIRI